MDETEKKLLELEARIVEQEHRLFPVLNNFFITRRKWTEDDPRRDAAVKALLWRIFFSPGTVAVTGAGIGLVTLAVMVWQNFLIKEQNQYFREQIAQQQQQLDAQQRVANQSTRSEAIERIYGPMYAKNTRVKAEAVRSLLAVERLIVASGTNTLPTDYINLHDAELQAAWLDSADLRKTSFRKAILSKAVFNNAKLGESSFRFVDAEGASFLSCQLNDAQFAFADISFAQYSHANLKGTLFTRCKLVEADFSKADLEKCSFVGCDLASADFAEVKNWRKIDSIRDSNIHQLSNAPPGFVEWALANGAVDNPTGIHLKPIRDAQLRLEEGPKAIAPAQ